MEGIRLIISSLSKQEAEFKIKKGMKQHPVPLDVVHTTSPLQYF